MVKDLTATGAMLARLSQFGLAWPGPACRYLVDLHVRRFSPGLYGLSQSQLSSQPLPFHIRPTNGQLAVGFLRVCRWFNKKCPKQVLFDPSEHVRRYRIPPGPVDESARIRHGASTTCLRLNLSPHYGAGQHN